MVDQVRLAAFSSWLMAGAQPPKPIEAIVEESAARLRAAIGPAVNLCARMLHEASARDARTLCSAQFRTIAIGLTGTPFTCEVAGFDKPVDVFVLD